MSYARSRVVACVVDENVLGEGFLRSEVARSPLTSTAIILMGMDGTEVEVDFVLVLVILSRTLCI